jgi:hypothetical protein
MVCPSSHRDAVCAKLMMRWHRRAETASLRFPSPMKVSIRCRGRRCWPLVGDTNVSGLPLCYPRTYLPHASAPPLATHHTPPPSSNGTFSNPHGRVQHGSQDNEPPPFALAHDETLRHRLHALTTARVRQKSDRVPGTYVAKAAGAIYRLLGHDDLVCSTATTTTLHTRARWATSPANTIVPMLRVS